MSMPLLPSRHRRPVAAVLAALLGTCCLSSHAQEDSIATDRPDFVESSSVVGKGRFQIETGFARETDRDGGHRTRVSTTPTLLRMGLGETWELRVETDGYARIRSEDRALATSERIQGMSDLALGVKWHMQEANDSGAPAIAWLLHADVPSGARDLRGDGVRPSLRMVAEWDLPQDFSLGLMPGVLVDKNEDGRRFTAGIAAVTLGKGWTDRLSTFIEIAGQQLTSERNGGPQVTYDTGATYLLTQDVQVDVSLSWGANRHTPDFQWGMGLSVRF